MNDLISSLNVQELKELNCYLKSKKKKEIIKELDSLIRKKERQRRLNLNYRFKIEMISTFSMEDMAILKKNKIRNMLDLIETDISKLEGITQGTKASLEWARNFYDLSGIKTKRKSR